MSEQELIKLATHEACKLVRIICEGVRFDLPLLEATIQEAIRNSVADEPEHLRYSGD